jgi:predicted DCC family thiol-disulfide oxidoreductase YuxK
VSDRSAEDGVATGSETGGLLRIQRLPRLAVLDTAVAVRSSAFLAIEPLTSVGRGAIIQRLVQKATRSRGRPLQGVGNDWGRPGPSLLLVYDDDCGFCRAVIGLLLALDRAGNLEAIGFDRVVELGVHCSADDRAWRRTWHAINNEGQWVSGAAVFSPLLRSLSNTSLLAWLAERFPGIAEVAYRVIAARRDAFGHLVPQFALAQADRFIAQRERVKRRPY